MRDVVLGGGRVDPTPEQLAAMRREIRLGLDAGARMLSFGLVYLPGAFAATGELVAVAEEAARAGVPLVPHVRNEGQGLLAAVEEMIEVAGRSGAALHLSHLKSLADERLIEPLLARLDEAAAEIDLSFDQYPYGAGSTLLASILPAWAQEGGARERSARSAAATSGAGSPATSRRGCRGGRTSSAPSGRNASRSPTQPRPMRTRSG